MTRHMARLTRLERERRRRQPDKPVMLVVFSEDEITEEQRRESNRAGLPIIILDR